MRPLIPITILRASALRNKFWQTKMRPFLCCFLVVVVVVAVVKLVAVVWYTSIITFVHCISVEIG